MPQVVGIILARGGSKSIPQKNITDFCGKPLIAWTIETTLKAGIKTVYVSSDSDDILEVSVKYGALPLKRPEEFSGDHATSEEGWLHSIKMLDLQGVLFDWVYAPQVTSPLTTVQDVVNGLDSLKQGNFDSLFSSSPIEDFFLWEKTGEFYKSINYDWRNRKRRQDIKEQYVENGSFYFFKPDFLIKNNNRLSGRIGAVNMEFWQMFEIDTPMDLRLCSAIMKEFILD
tara:strand:- start:463 stop:1146 length:684 start_codon:yes stop_codon:yes gene_type:complete